MAKRRALIICLIALMLLGLSSINALAASPAQGTPPPSTPTVTPTPTDDGGVITSISQIFHHLVFPAETISEALAGIFNKAANREAGRMGEEIAKWTGVIGDIVQAPREGDYARAAQSSLPVAAALAPALFLLRLALYHWGRLVGEQDSGLQVIGDWVTAGVLAVVAGPFLDMVVRLGWWMQGQVLGETSDLALQFIKSTTATSLALGIANRTFFGGILTLGLSLGSLVAIAGLLFAFASANAALFILSISAAPLAVASVVPQARWLRSLWIKALLIIAILPIAAGGVFKAGLASSYLFDRQGLLSGIIRVIWLWGATGMLLSLSGILGKMTITATADGLKAMVGTVQQIASIAALAAAGAGALGAGGAAAGAGAGSGAATATEGAGAGMSGASAAASSLPASGESAALGHLNAAQDLTRQAATFDALGLRAPAQFSRAMAHSHELSARQVELNQRMQRVTEGEISVETQGADFGFAPNVNRGIAATFQGSKAEFDQGYQGVSPLLSQHGLTPELFASQYPEDTGRLVQAYLAHSDEIRQARDPLFRAGELGGIEKAREVIEFTPLNWRSGDPTA
jgi:hypothetical protein